MSNSPSLCLPCSGKMMIWASLRRSSDCRRSSATSTNSLSANSSYHAMERMLHLLGEWVTLSMSSVERTASSFSITEAMTTQIGTGTSRRCGRREFHLVPLVPTILTRTESGQAGQRQAGILSIPFLASRMEMYCSCWTVAMHDRQPGIGLLTSSNFWRQQR